jgi:hypothetical protein
MKRKTNFFIIISKSVFVLVILIRLIDKHDFHYFVTKAYRNLKSAKNFFKIEKVKATKKNCDDDFFLLRVFLSLGKNVSEYATKRDNFCWFFYFVEKLLTGHQLICRILHSSRISIRMRP